MAHYIPYETERINLSFREDDDWRRLEKIAAIRIKSVAFVSLPFGNSERVEALRLRCERHVFEDDVKRCQMQSAFSGSSWWIVTVMDEHNMLPIVVDFPTLKLAKSLAETPPTAGSSPTCVNYKEAKTLKQFSHPARSKLLWEPPLIDAVGHVYNLIFSKLCFFSLYIS